MTKLLGFHTAAHRKERAQKVYSYNRLIRLNKYGTHPTSPISLADWVTHTELSYRDLKWPEKALQTAIQHARDVRTTVFRCVLSEIKTVNTRKIVKGRVEWKKRSPPDDGTTVRTCIASQTKRERLGKKICLWSTFTQTWSVKDIKWHQSSCFVLDIISSSSQGILGPPMLPFDSLATTHLFWLPTIELLNLFQI